ncbi:hypothetical protein P3T24_005760 [Paraburkholderia sp. GAS33]|jgi:hypothetical protein|uniref:Uncharacterized protein n=1 Tax=Paraburkholderia phenazinium TaxID=60549 RepID=A0A1N6HX94_9BURK|nr:hypothetical protein SAMN05444168_3723 [Paraburkholderia phenazinium]
MCRATVLNQGEARVHLRLAIGGGRLYCDRQWSIRYLMAVFPMVDRWESL